MNKVLSYNKFLSIPDVNTKKPPECHRDTWAVCNNVKTTTNY